MTRSPHPAWNDGKGRLEGVVEANVTADAHVMFRPRDSGGQAPCHAALIAPFVNNNGLTLTMNMREATLCIKKVERAAERNGFFFPTT